MLSTLITVVLFISSSTAEYGYPPTVSGLQTIRANPSGTSGVHVTFKQPGQEICRTKNPNQKQYAGHVHFPPGTLEAPIEQEYPINTFFWFVEARENPQDAPLTIWLNGGPGSSSLLGMMQEVGPCKAVPFSRESISTVVREFGWDGVSNMLFLDQPNQVGFSYDVPTNGTMPLLDVNGVYQLGDAAPPDEQQPKADEIELKDGYTVKEYLDALRSTALINGTFSSGNSSNTAKTTGVAASAAWHFLQAWLQYFPQYNPGRTGINLFAESYGGKYGPAFFRYFEEQNERRRTGSLSINGTLELQLASLGIVNGWVDSVIQTPWYVNYAHQNPYGIEAVSAQVRDKALEEFEEDGGCKDMIKTCRELVAMFDPKSLGTNDQVNGVCSKASQRCDSIRGRYHESGRGIYDIAAHHKDPFPGEYHKEYLNNATVMEAIGAWTNFTGNSPYVFTGFGDTGDSVRAEGMKEISYLLQHGLRVALIYGDRDYICNYQGGEAVSLALDYPEKEAFRASGYQDIRVNDGYVGGQVRQYGNFSFSRVYQAGHLVPAYQPETAFRLYERIVKGLSIATGDKIQIGGNGTYSTTGPANTTQTLVAPEPPESTCFVRDINTCDDVSWEAFANKRAVIYNGVVYNSSSDYPEDPLALFNIVSPKKRPQQYGMAAGAVFEVDTADIFAPSFGALLVALLSCSLFL